MHSCLLAHTDTPVIYPSELIILEPRLKAAGRQERIPVVRGAQGPNGEPSFFVAPWNVKRVAKARITCEARQWQGSPALRWNTKVDNMKETRNISCTGENIGHCFARTLILRDFNKTKPAEKHRYTCHAESVAKKILRTAAVHLSIGGELSHLLQMSICAQTWKSFT